MFKTIHGYGSGRTVGEVRRGRPADPLVKTIVMDIVVTTTGFALIVAALLLTVQGLSLS